MLCNAYFPFYITYILTDNGLEFRDKLARVKFDNYVAYCPFFVFISV